MPQGTQLINPATSVAALGGPFVKIAGDTMTGALILPNGSAAAAALGVGAANTGLFRDGAGNLGMTVGGVSLFRLTNDTLELGDVGLATAVADHPLHVFGETAGTSRARAIFWDSADDPYIMFRRSAGTLAGPGALTAADIVLASFYFQGRTNTAFVNAALIEARTAESYSIGNQGAYMVFSVSTSTTLTERMRLTSLGNVILGSQVALATTATDGFAYISTSAGIPTGVATAVTGKAPIHIDTTNNVLYFFANAAWRAPSLAAGSFPLLAPDGTAAAPSYSFADEPDTGMFLTDSATAAAEILSFAAAGLEVFRVFRFAADGTTVRLAAAVGSLGLIEPTSTFTVMRSGAGADVMVWGTGNQASLTLRRADGTLGAPSAPAGGSNLALISGEGHDGTAYYAGGDIQFNVGAGGGKRTDFILRTITSTALVQRVKIRSDLNEFHIGGTFTSAQLLRINRAEGGGNEAGIGPSVLDIAAEGTVVGERTMRLTYSDTSAGSPILFLLKSRGSQAARTAVASGDTLANISAAGHTGTDFVVAGQLLFSASETWSGTVKGANVQLNLNKTGSFADASKRWEILGTGLHTWFDADAVARMQLGTDGRLGLSSGGTLAAAVSAGILIHAFSQTESNSILGYHAADATSVVLNFRKSRGTFATPAAVSSGDGILSLQAQAYADAYQNAMQLRVVAAETWSATVSGANFFLDLSKTGADNTTTNRYDITGAGVHTKRDADGAQIFQITNAGSVVCGALAALAQAATDGFLYIPTITAGAASGTPTAQTGKAAIYFDTTNNKIGVYDAGWLHTAALT